MKFKRHCVMSILVANLVELNVIPTREKEQEEEEKKNEMK